MLGFETKHEPIKGMFAKRIREQISGVSNKTKEGREINQTQHVVNGKRFVAVWKD